MEEMDIMKYDSLDLGKFEKNFGGDTDKFQRIKRTRPEKDEEARAKGRKLNHRTKKKKDIEI
jgi:hypothetical protein